ncbi:12808_t:CDS:1 [Dentiscutata heterogama]|uniref:12808_t:CDS:1 n=1 Tax=Dentiscutata heterogama TaxID=1316150 RepID=A0ACA9JXN0_9GLOM|nr:12808_t:CDS:1 [Dentiscutata heterogama]
MANLAGKVAGNPDLHNADPTTVIPELVNSWDQPNYVTGFDVLKSRVKQICNVVHNVFDSKIILEIARQIWTDSTSPEQRDMYTNFASRVNQQKFGCPVRDPGILIEPPTEPLISIPPTKISDSLLYVDDISQ